jgi:hypothetical protein
MRKNQGGVPTQIQFIQAFQGNGRNRITQFSFEEKPGVTITSFLLRRRRKPWPPLAASIKLKGI